MKIIILFLLLFSLTFQKNILKDNHNTKIKNIIGINTNSGNNAVDATTYNHLPENKSNNLLGYSMISPKYIDSLDSIRSEKPLFSLLKEDQNKVTAEQNHENISDKAKNYYDGADNLHAQRIDCSEFNRDPKECFNSAHCGWCEENKSCIPGTKLGPLRPCKKESFLYFEPAGKWDLNRFINPEYQLINK